MIHDIAFGVGSTVARINARAIGTRIISCAFAVRYALRHDLRWYAFDRGLADVANRTSADWIVIVNMAQGVPATRITSDARIYAKRIYALLITRALTIRVALRSKTWKRWNDRNSYALYVSVARKVLRTEADTGMRC